MVVRDEDYECLWCGEREVYGSGMRFHFLPPPIIMLKNIN